MKLHPSTMEHCKSIERKYMMWWQKAETESNDRLVDLQLCNNDSTININNSLYLYSAFLGTQSALHRRGGGISSTTTSVQHPPGWCDGSHISPERPPHTSLLVERRQTDEANQCMGMIRRPWWSEANGEIWPDCRGYTPTLFRRTSWDLILWDF